MSGGSATIEDLLARIDRLERKLDAALRPAPRLLSRRAAAKMLGVDRGTTLEAWIRSGALRLVEGKIPLAALEKLIAEGAPHPARRMKRPAPANDPAEEIRKISV